MLRKKISLCTALLFLFCGNAMPDAAKAETSIKIGQYLEMGTYYGEPVLWRCVDIDENGPLMLAHRIICLKPFDAAGSDISGSHGRGYYTNETQGGYRQEYGSDYWADSNIRCWLNSDAEAGNAVWLCGNPPDNSHVDGGYNDYADEQGFKRNFTPQELGAVKTVTQKSLLNAYEYAGPSNNYVQNYHKFDYYIINILQNYDTAYSEEVSDDFFLPDVKQINAVYKNRAALGAEYYIGKPTAECVNNSENKYTGLSDTGNWHCWLRSTQAYSSGYIRDVAPDGYVFYNRANNGNGGVRPAFYLDTASARFASGDGTLSAPYKVGGAAENEGVTVEVERAELTGAGALITAHVDNASGDRAEGNAYIAVYSENGELAGISVHGFLLDSPETRDTITARISGDDISSYKIFVWDDIEPLTNVISDELQVYGNG